MFQCHESVSSNCLLCANKFPFPSIHRVIIVGWEEGETDDRLQFANDNVQAHVMSLQKHGKVKRNTHESLSG